MIANPPNSSPDAETLPDTAGKLLTSRLSVHTSFLSSCPLKPRAQGQWDLAVRPVLPTTLAQGTNIRAQPGHHSPRRPRPPADALAGVGMSPLHLQTLEKNPTSLPLLPIPSQHFQHSK